MKTRIARTLPLVAITALFLSPMASAQDADLDLDGLTDADEITIYHTNPYSADTDGDGVDDGEEVNTHFSDPLSIDSDSDGLYDGEEANTYKSSLIQVDSDSDGLNDGVEVNTYHTDPIKADTDGDLLVDGREVYIYHSNPLVTDTDGDGLSDSLEVNAYGTDPIKADSDNDGVNDKLDYDTYHPPLNGTDTDADGLIDRLELYVYHTDPNKADTDGDGLTDGLEVNTYHTDPTKTDTDGDGLSDFEELTDADDDFLFDAEELVLGTAPYDKDSDGDGIWDRDEVYPYQIVTRPTGFTFDEAMADAAAKGGWLAIIDSPQKLYKIKRGLLNTPLPSPMPNNNYDPATTLANPIWIGAHDKLVDGRYQWVKPGTLLTARLEGALIGSAAYVNMMPGSATISNVVNINSFDMGRPFVASGVPTGTTVTSIDSAARTLTLSNPVDSILSQRVARIVVSNGGFGYNVPPYTPSNPAPVVKFSGAAFGISSVSVTAGGSGYNPATPPTLTFSGGGGSGAAAHAVVVGGVVTNIVIDNRGVNYTTTPTITITHNGGTGFSAKIPELTTSVTVTPDGRIQTIEITGDGATYDGTAPTVTITGNSGGGAIARAVLTPAASANIETVKVLSGGSGYTSQPTVTFTGGGGTGAMGVGSINGSGQVTSVVMLSYGAGYISTPTAIFTGGGGSGATASVTIRQFATLVQSPVTGAYVNWSTGLLGNRINSQEGVLLDAGNAFTWTTAVETESHSYLLELPPTDPTKADTDDDGLSDFEELNNSPTTNPILADTDNDGVNDGLEINTYHSNPALVDTDGDGLTDGLEVNTHHTDPTKSDTDGDGLSDFAELNSTPSTNPNLADTDSDGVNDGLEVNTYHSNPLVVDTDADGLTDGQEINTYNTSPTFADTDGDGLTDSQEVNTLLTDPTNADTDGDGLSDFAELNSTPLTNPNLADTDNDALTDGQEVNTYHSNPTVVDTDGDGLNDGEEVNTHKTNPILADTDSDGLTDGQEVNTHNTNPILADTDGDGVNDGLEVNTYLSNPRVVDTDSDGVDDGEEVNVLHTDPTRPFDIKAGTTQIPFASGLVNGSYEGLVYDPVNGLSFRHKITLSSNGSFSASISGLPKNAMKQPMDTSYKGQFTALGELTKLVTAGSLTSVQMNVEKRGANGYYIHGLFTNDIGEQLYFELHRNNYSKSQPYPKPGKVTFAASPDIATPGPAGHAVATGEIRSDGKVLFSAYLPDGSRSSYSGAIVTGDIINLYTRTSAKSRTTLVGALAIRDTPAASDFDGTVRLFSNVEISSSLFPYGFDQFRNLIGSRYTPPAVGRLPLPNFPVSPNNALYLWIGGNFDGVEKVGTWTTNSTMVIPPSSMDSSKLTFVASTGLMTLSYTRTDASRDLWKATSKGYSVVLQKNETFKGFYTSSLSAGDFEVLPNAPNEDD